MAHKMRPVSSKNIQRLPITQMTQSATDTVFEIDGIITFFKHILIIIRFQESGMALLKIFDQMLTWCANISKNTHTNIVVRNHKTKGITCIMKFWKSDNRQSFDNYRLMCIESFHQLIFKT